MNTVLFRAVVLVLGFLSLTFFTSEGVPQTPGVKPKPETKEEKLKEATSVVGDFINLYEAEVGPGEVDKRKDAFMKKHFGSEGAGVIQLGKRKYLVTFGEVEMAFEAKPGWTQRRILAMGRAELVARAKMVEAIETKIDSEQLFEVFQDYGDAVKKNIGFIQEARKKGALSATGYQEALRTFAMGQVIGGVTIKTIEGMNGSMYKIVRIVIWSPTLRDLAINTLLDTDYLLPLEKVAEDDLDQIPQKEADLVREIGCKVYFNKKGQRYYVSYGQAEPLARNKGEVPIAMEAARGRAELAAKGSLARTLAAEVTSVKLGEMTNDEIVGKEDKTDVLFGNFYQRMDTVAKGIKVKGITVHKTWTYKHPEWKSVVVGCVVVWTPDTRSVIKEVGLDKRFDVNRPDALAAYLVKAYTKAEPITPIGKKPGVGDSGKKPGENDSKDPKKIP